MSDPSDLVGPFFLFGAKISFSAPLNDFFPGKSGRLSVKGEEVGGEPPNSATFFRENFWQFVVVFHNYEMRQRLSSISHARKGEITTNPPIEVIMI